MSKLRILMGKHFAPSCKKENSIPVCQELPAVVCVCVCVCDCGQGRGEGECG